MLITSCNCLRYNRTVLNFYINPNLAAKNAGPEFFIYRITMIQKEKTKEGLIEEIKLLQKRIAELETLNSKLKKTEQIAGEAREYAKNIVETVREPLLVLDAELKLISANRSFYRTFKVNPEESEGRFIYDVGNRQWDIPKLRHLLEEILHKNSTFDNYEIERHFETIGQRTMLLNARRLYREPHRAQMILLSIEDITEVKKRAEREKELVAAAAAAENKRTAELEKAYKSLKEMQERLVRSKKLAAIGKVAGMMAHEIRNPLGVIRSSVYFLNMKLKESMDEKVKKHLDILQTEIDASDKIISDVLTFAHIEAPTLEEAEINCVVKEVLSKATIPKTVRVKADLGERLPKILVDAAQIKQVFSNIILNAVQAMPDGGELKISTNQTDKFIAVSFKDSGCGISRENLDNIFEALVSTKAKGVGLGLTTCQSIIEGHRGKIEVESEVNKGTTFTITLPLA